MSQEQVIFQFARGTDRHLKKAPKFRAATSSTSFRNVRRDMEACRTAQLAC